MVGRQVSQWFKEMDFALLDDRIRKITADGVSDGRVCGLGGILDQDGRSLSLPVTESFIGSQRALPQHSKSFCLPAKQSFIGNQRVIHRQSPTGRALLCIFLNKQAPRCGTRETVLGRTRQLIMQKKCHPGEHLFDSFRCLWPEQPCHCAEMCSHAHVRATNIFCPEFHQHSLLRQMRVKSAAAGALD